MGQLKIMKGQSPSKEDTLYLDMVLDLYFCQVKRFARIENINYVLLVLYEITIRESVTTVTVVSFLYFIFQR